jgi:hypothetical protein
MKHNLKGFSLSTLLTMNLCKSYRIYQIKKPHLLAIFIVFQADVMHERFKVLRGNKSTEFTAASITTCHCGDPLIENPVDKSKYRKA